MSDGTSTDLSRSGSLPGSAQVGAISTPEPDAAGALCFGPYMLSRSARTLTRDGQPVEIGSRAFDLLALLLSARGKIVSKAEVLAYVWPSMVVEESNLRFQIATLRKTVPETRDLIRTIPGRGYMFVLDDEHTSSGLRMPSERQGTMPAERSHARGPFSTKAESPPEADETNRADVAVVDDDAPTREAICSLLECVGLNVRTFASVQEFLSAFPVPAPKCLILDVWMPGRSGLELQAELAKANVRLPVIFISGHADVHTSVRAMKLGASEFLTKPVRHEELLLAVRTAIASAQGPLP